VPLFKARITVVTTEIFIYKAKAESLAAAHFTAEHQDADPETMKSRNVVKRIALTEITSK
jgi:hypothetical protein